MHAHYLIDSRQVNQVCHKLCAKPHFRDNFMRFRNIFFRLDFMLLIRIPVSYEFFLCVYFSFPLIQITIIILQTIICSIIYIVISIARNLVLESEATYIAIFVILSKCKYLHLNWGGSPVILSNLWPLTSQCRLKLKVNVYPIVTKHIQIYQIHYEPKKYVENDRHSGKAPLTFSGLIYYQPYHTM